MATFRDLKTYLERDGGWDEIPNLVRGRRRVGDHWRYRKVLSDGTVLRTKVSHTLDEEIGPDLLGHIVRDQLRTAIKHFRDVVAGRLPEPDAGCGENPEPIPGWLVVRLIHTVGLSEQQVRAMSAEQAQAAWERYKRGQG